MKTTFIDENGMVSLPSEYIAAQGLCAGSRIDITIGEESLSIRPAENICIICGCSKTIDGFDICKNCSKTIYDRRINNDSQNG